MQEDHEEITAHFNEINNHIHVDRTSNNNTIETSNTNVEKSNKVSNGISSNTLLDVKQTNETERQSHNSMGNIKKVGLKNITKTSIKKFTFSIELHDQGWYQLGKSEVTDQYFTLWISIAFAENMKLLKMRDDLVGYYFHYTILGNDIMTQR